MQDYRHLKTWHLAEDIAERLLSSLSAADNYRAPGMRAQLIRAAHSVSSNIAEGCSRRSPAEFRRYLELSLGSLYEVESSLDLALRGRLLRGPVHTELVRRCAVLRRMLCALIARVDESIANGEEAARRARLRQPAKST